MIKVVRYQNYGCMNSGGVDSKGELEKDHIKFYYCFFELNNGKIIYSQFEEYSNKEIENDVSFLHTKSYSFGQEFWDWWDTDSERWLEPITQEEWECVEPFFKKRIQDNRAQTTGIINIGHHIN